MTDKHDAMESPDAVQSTGAKELKRRLKKALVALRPPLIDKPAPEQKS